MEVKFIGENSELSGKVQEVQDKLDEIIESNRQKAKESPEYQEMMKHFKKSLSDINKDACKSPWEPSWAVDYFVEFLRFMQRYYELGINVWALERKDEDPKRYKNVPTRYEAITKALSYYDKWQGLEDEYIQVVKDGEYKDHKNDDGTYTVEHTGYKCIYKYGNMKKTYKKLHKEQKKYKKLFVNYVADNMREWWD